MFNLDHTTLLNQLTWRVVRTSMNTDFFKSAIKPLTDIYSSLIELRTKLKYDLQFTGQVIYLTQLLNDKFDPVDRSIYISDVANIDYTFIYNDSESSPPKYIYNDNEPFNGIYIETDQEQVSNQQFIINIPSTGINIHELRKIVDRYKLAGKNYVVVIF